MHKPLIFIIFSYANISFCAASSSCTDIAELSTSFTESCSISSPLLIAARDGDDKRVRELLHQDHDAYLPDSTDGMTPLMFAARNGHIAVVKTLLYLAPNRIDLLTATSNAKKCALEYAKEYNHQEIVEDLTHMHKLMQFKRISKTHFSPNILPAILKLIDNEKKCIRGAMYRFTHGDPARALVKKKQSGIPVTLVIDEGYKTDLCIALKHMMQNEISVATASMGINPKADYPYFNMHHKFLIFSQNDLDRTLLLTGSCNFTGQAFKHNWEDMTITDDIKSITKFEAQLSKLEANSKPITAAECIADYGKDTDTSFKAKKSRERNAVATPL